MTVAEPDTSSLSRLLREGSQAEHQAAEGSSFMTELLAGRVNARGYADYLARLRRVYDALESLGRALAGDPVADAVLDPALERTPSIDADQAQWGVGHGATPATDAYVARIESIAASPARFVAHHYTRYLGDLSGGRIIGRLLEQTFERPDGLAFYAFPGIPKPKPYKDAYRARLDGLDLTAEEKLAVLTEVKTVFGLNGALFEELTANLDAYRR
ncbi:biliverdin-producing heme oxygenase [Aeromicrobium sp.]|uniref:biliverdin-producing heme oxygenase n=1 Tax=Aeromicrobium sp. TaxID=1871063 RepID=UPI0040342B7A